VVATDLGSVEAGTRVAKDNLSHIITVAFWTCIERSAAKSYVFGEQQNTHPIWSIRHFAAHSAAYSAFFMCVFKCDLNVHTYGRPTPVLPPSYR
jgi:hypothetical protein